ncbi:MAG: Jag N-terminal domain-containing protein [Sulfurospirillum sp.]|nr:Jag N-terminal domain-containing protein [Sulfurospirillum sp.]
MRIEAKNLADAYSKAATALECSVTQITITVIQHPSSGFLGMFQKNAIIEACKTTDVKKESVQKVDAAIKKMPKIEETAKNVLHVSEPMLDASQKDERRKNKNKNKKNKKKEPSAIEPKPQVAQKIESVATTQEVKKPNPKTEQKPRGDIQKAIPEINEAINNLFAHSCFVLNAINVSSYDEITVLVEFSGEDAALLIGKEGYRYKALSYLLYNWINLKYNLNIRLEIAEFLKNQEEMIEKYLIGVVERVNANGRAQTKILDGVLVKIALESLRETFPQKYVGIKSGREGGKFIVINDFNRKNQ